MKRLYSALSIILSASLAIPVLARPGPRPNGAASDPKGRTETGTAQSGVAGVILIRNATIMTASHGTIKNGSILIRDGKIAAVGQNVRSSDPGIREMEATGKYITRGIIDCHSHTAVEGNVNEGTLSVTSMVRIRDVIDPYNPDVYRELAGGVTTINILHGSANSIGG